MTRAVSTHSQTGPQSGYMTRAVSTHSQTGPQSGYMTRAVSTHSQTGPQSGYMTRAVSTHSQTGPQSGYMTRAGTLKSAPARQDRSPQSTFYSSAPPPPPTHTHTHPSSEKPERSSGLKTQEVWKCFQTLHGCSVSIFMQQQYFSCPRTHGCLLVRSLSMKSRTGLAHDVINTCATHAGLVHKEKKSK